MSTETIIGDDGKAQDIWKRKIPECVSSLMEIMAGQLHHGDSVIFYVPERFSDYCLNSLTGNLDQYHGIVAARVIFRPSAKYLADYSRKDADITCVGVGVDWMGVKLEGDKSWREEVSIGVSEKKLSKMGWYFSELNPKVDGQKTCIVGAGSFRDPFHSLKIQLDVANGISRYVEETL